MANQPEDTPKGQWTFNSGAQPPKQVITRVSKAIDPSNQAQNMKRIPHNTRIARHNSRVSGN